MALRTSVEPRRTRCSLKCSAHFDAESLCSEAPQAENLPWLSDEACTLLIRGDAVAESEAAEEEAPRTLTVNFAPEDFCSIQFFVLGVGCEGSNFPFVVILLGGGAGGGIMHAEVAGFCVTFVDAPCPTSAIL